jgi:hypothetical protein
MHSPDTLPTYRLLDRDVLASGPHWQTILARSYAAVQRPLCLCTAAGVPMCVVKDGAFYLRRMPDTGHLHHPSCTHYEPQLRWSGRAYLQGDALVEGADGAIEAHSDFAMERYGLHAGRARSPAQAPALAMRKKRLTLRGLLHLIWDQAQFNRWSPNMQGKRNWAVIRHFATQAAERIVLKGAPLAQRLFMPEAFHAEHALQIHQRREQRFASMLPGATCDRHRLLLVIGELKELKQISVGYRLTLKHAPDCAFLVEQKLAGRVMRLCADAFQARDTLPGTRLLSAFTLAVNALDDYRVDTMTVMAVTENWIPFANAYEKKLTDALTLARRRFIKPLDYDAPAAVAIPDFLLLDAGDAVLAMYIALATASKTRKRAQDELIKHTAGPAWVWATQSTLSLPALPTPVLSASRRNGGVASRLLSLRA